MHRAACYLGGMIRKVRIQRFRSILDAELEFGRVNLFIGGNGSGKSNVLEALGIVSAALGRGVDAQSLAERGVRLSRPHLFKSSFRNHDHPLTFHLSTEISGGGQDELRYDCGIYGGERTSELAFHSESLMVGEKKLLGRSNRGAKIHEAPSLEIARLKANRSLWDQAGQFVEIAEEYVQAIETVASYAIFSPQTSVMRGLSRVDVPLQPLGLEGTGLAGCLNDIYQDLRRLSRSPLREQLDQITELPNLPGWTDSIEVGEPDPEILPDSVMLSAGETILYLRDRFMRTDRNYLSPFDASEGTLYLSFVAALMGHAHTPSIFALDNVDGTLNPGLVRKLVEQIAQTTCSQAARMHPRLPQQVFLTTHNPTALDALDLFNSDHRIFVVYRESGKREHGATRFYRLQPPPGMTRDQWIVTQRGLNLSELWIEGRIREALG